MNNYELLLKEKNFTKAEQKFLIQIADLKNVMPLDMVELREIIELLDKSISYTIGEAESQKMIEEQCIGFKDAIAVYVLEESLLLDVQRITERMYAIEQQIDENTIIRVSHKQNLSMNKSEQKIIWLVIK